MALALLLLLLAGCAETAPPPVTPDSLLAEKPGTLPPDTLALRTAQQCAPGGISHHIRILLLQQALLERDLAPSSAWTSTEKTPGEVYEVKATLTATGRPPTEFVWKVDLKQPPGTVVQPVSSTAVMLTKIRVKLDESGLESFLGPRVVKAPGAAPRAKPDV